LRFLLPPTIPLVSLTLLAPAGPLPHSLISRARSLRLFSLGPPLEARLCTQHFTPRTDPGPHISRPALTRLRPMGPARPSPGPAQLALGPAQARLGRLAQSGPRGTRPLSTHLSPPYLTLLTLGQQPEGPVLGLARQARPTPRPACTHRPQPHSPRHGQGRPYHGSRLATRIARSWRPLA
jgi:hypothetical protein